MAEEPRFDWPSILRSIAIIAGVTGLLGFALPPALTLALTLYKTGFVAGNDLFTWGFWAVAWILTFVQGAWILRHVGTKIIDDMLVVAIGSAFLLFVLKLIIAFVYEPISPDGKALPIANGIDAGGAVMLVIVALIAARANRY